MAKRIIEIPIQTIQQEIKDDQGNTQRVYDVANYDKVFKEILRSAVSAVSKGNVAELTQKYVDPSTGQGFANLLIEAKDYTNVLKALDKVSADTSAFSYSSKQKASFVRGQVTLHGAEAVKRAREMMKAQGIVGELNRVSPDSDVYRYRFYDTDRDTANKFLSSARDISSKTYTRQKKEEKEEAEFQKNKAQAKQLAEEDKQKAQAKKEADKAWTDFEKQQKAEEKTAEKEKQKQQRDTKLTVLKVISAITLLTDITRRILSSVLASAVEATRTAQTAHNLGMSYESAREFGVLETAHGLEKGTLTGAVRDIQNKFGNIANLDENALSQLALVMGSSIQEMVESGMGGKRPEELLGSIIDSYVARAESGYNSVGKYVGRQDATRELYSQLSRISPQIADLFGVMLDEKNNVNSIYREMFDTFEEWRKTLATNRGGFTTAEFGVADTLGELVNKTTSIIDQIKKGIMVELAPDLAQALNRISQSRIFMSEEEKLEQSRKSRKINEAIIADTSRRLEALPDERTIADPALRTEIRERRRLLTQVKTMAEEENKKSDIDNIIAQQYYTQSWLETEVSRNVEDTLRDKFSYESATIDPMYWGEAGKEAYTGEEASAKARKKASDVREIMALTFRYNQLKKKKKKDLTADEKRELEKLKSNDMLYNMTFTDEKLALTGNDLEAYIDELTYNYLGLNDPLGLGTKKYLPWVAEQHGKASQTSDLAVSSFLASMDFDEQDIRDSLTEEMLAVLKNNGDISVRGYTDRSGGEAVYRVVLDITENGEVKKSLDLLESAQGVDLGGDRTVANVQVVNGEIVVSNALNANSAYGASASSK